MREKEKGFVWIELLDFLKSNVVDDFVKELFHYWTKIS